MKNKINVKKKNTSVTNEVPNKLKKREKRKMIIFHSLESTKKVHTKPNA